jgi:alpha-glucosidase
VTGTITTPWRVVLVGEDLNALVNSDIVTNLCPAPDPKLFPQGVSTDWVKPGRAVWRYLDNGTRATTAPEDRGTRPPAPTSRPVWPRLKRGELGPLVFASTQPSTGRRGQRNGGGKSRETSRPTSRQSVRVEEIDDRWTAPAAQLGFEHNILEGFWRGWSRAQLKQVIDFGKQHGVGIWLWKHSQDFRDPVARREFFQMCREVGVAGAKIDFFDHEHKEMVDLYQAILHDAAVNHVLLDFHGANKPTGESRTWPNELTREAVRGMEASRLKERALHEVTLPFTRFLAGHAEYTPVHFGERRGDTTWAHQVALPVIFTTELMTYAASPEHISESPAADVIKSIPTTWDETRVLPPSEIGEVAVFARRKGTTWFLAIANGPAERSVEVPLTFLDASATYRAKVVKDTETDRAAIDVSDASYSREVAIELKLVPGGGFVARFEK